MRAAEGGSSTLDCASRHRAAGARSRLHVGRPDAQLVARRRALVAPDEREALGRLHLELEVGERLGRHRVLVELHVVGAL
eukprot:279241-Prymnesium_polylepis.1